MSNEKVWAQAAYGLKRMFPNGGSKIELDLKWEEFKAWAEQNVNEKGYLKLEIQGSREPRMDEKGNEKLNVSLNTWKPSGQQQPTQQGVAPQYAPPVQPVQQPQHQQPVQQPQYQQPMAPGGNPVPQNPTMPMQQG